MSLLVDHEIRDLIKKGELKVEPFDNSLINPSGLDFRCGRHYTKTVPTGKRVWQRSERGAVREVIGYDQVGPDTYEEFEYAWALPRIDPTDKSTFRDETFEADEYWLAPGETILVSMMEKLTLPPYMSMKIAGKSSLARLFVDNSSPGGYLDPSWTGYITLEISNWRQDAFVRLSEGMKLGQLLIFTHELPEKDYLETGRYINQKPGSGSLGV
jgi:dCTP deaminase